MSDLGPDVPLSVGAFIRQAIGEDMGVTAARSLMREQGLGSMSNEAFGQLYGQIRAAVGNRDVIGSLDYSMVPDADTFTPWAAGTPDRYASFVEVYVREPGTRTVSSRFYTYVTDDAHTPQEAVDAAMDSMSQAAASGGTDFDAVVIDGVVTSMTRTVAR